MELIDRKDNMKINIVHVLSAIFSLILITSFLFLNEIVPFGNYTLATMDADIQYLDLFAYLQELLSGSKSIGYDFSKGLGGNNFAIFSYYLASPINLLVIFFNKSELHKFFSLAFTIKIVLATVTSSIFLCNRFGNLKAIYAILLSAGYAFSQYTILQASNIMWLDGVYMLPLVLLGIYRIIHHKKPGLLAIAIAISMIFNWYSGVINCLFSVIWLLFEISFHSKSLRNNILIIIRYSSEVLVGLLLCAVVFLPTYIELQNGKGGLDLWLINIDFSGNIINLLQGIIIGAKESRGNLSLFSGTIALIGICVYFVSSSFSSNKKDSLVLLLFLVTILLYYWNPLILVFSVFKKVDSYWYRYSYLAHFVYIFVAAYALVTHKLIDNLSKLIRVSVLLFLVMLFIAYVKDSQYSLIYLGAFIYFILLGLLWFAENNKYLNRLCYVFIFAISFGELYGNAVYIKNIRNDVSNFIIYTNNQEKLISSLKAKDSSFYRVSQIKNRKTKNDNTTAYYLDSFSYGYAGVNTYTSSSDKQQLELLNSLGYPQYAETLNVVNTSILPVDSLLGVKYILSDKTINGLIKMDDNYGDKSIYVNPYVLPLGITYSRDSALYHGEFSRNPFNNVNDIYSYLLGRKVSIFKKMNHEIVNKIGYVDILFNQNKSDNIYGYIDTKRNINSKLYLNDKFLTGYSKWLAPRVIYLGDERENRLRLLLDNATIKDVSTIEIYSLDLDLFNSVISELRSKNIIKKSHIDDGNVKFYTDLIKENYSLLITIPHSSGWEFKINGESVIPNIIYNSFISFDLVAGKEYVIEMNYSIPKLYLGVFLSLIGLLFLVYFLIRGNYVKKTNC